MDKKENTTDLFLADIEKELPPIVFRNWPRWRDILPMSPRSVANDDCIGIGPKDKIYMGRVAGYPKASLMAYLRAKTRIAPEGGKHGNDK